MAIASRRAVETGQCKVVAEISNAAYQWRFLAAAMGLPFFPTRNLLGTDTLLHSSAKVVADPSTGLPTASSRRATPTLPSSTSRAATGMATRRSTVP